MQFMAMISSGKSAGSDRGPPLYVTLSQLFDSTMVNLAGGALPEDDARCTYYKTLLVS